MFASIMSSSIMRSITTPRTEEIKSLKSSEETPVPMMTTTNATTPTTASTADITANTTVSSSSSMISDYILATISKSNSNSSGAITNSTERSTTVSSPKNQSIPNNYDDSRETLTAKAKTSLESTKPPETAETIGPPELWAVLDRELRSNMGTSVRCGICLSTVTDPVRTKCGHGFCRDCITNYLQFSGRLFCPECNSPCTKRSLEPFEQLDDLADAYKSMLRAFALAPGTYRPEITTMTQKVDFGSHKRKKYNEEEEGEEDDNSARSRFNRLCVAKTYQIEALPFCSEISSNIQIEENNLIVTANFEACCGDDGSNYEGDFDFDIDEMVSSHLSGRLVKNKSGTNDVTTTSSIDNIKRCSQPQDRPSQPTSHPLLALSGTLPSTQEVQEQAREQLEADREMQESVEEGHHDHDALLAKDQRKKVDTNDDTDGEDFVTLRKTLTRNKVHDPGTAPTPLPPPPVNAKGNVNSNDGNGNDAELQLFATATQGDGYGNEGLIPNEETKRQRDKQLNSSVRESEHAMVGTSSVIQSPSVSFKVSRSLTKTRIVKRVRMAIDNNEPVIKDNDKSTTASTNLDTKEYVFEGSPPLAPSPLLSPPSFARADTGTRNLRHTKKSFSKRDLRQKRLSPLRTATPLGGNGELKTATHNATLASPFETESLSPICQESSYWLDNPIDDDINDHGSNKRKETGEITSANIRSNVDYPSQLDQKQASSIEMQASTMRERPRRCSSIGINVTGMVEDSMGGLHMLPLKDGNDGATFAKTNVSDKNGVSKSNGIALSDYDNGEGKGDKDDSKNGDSDELTAQKIKYKIDDGGDDDDSDKTIPITEDDHQSPEDFVQEKNKKGDDDNSVGKDNAKKSTHKGLQTNDPRNATRVTDELHKITKEAIGSAVNPPVELQSKKISRRQRPAKKNLFTSHGNDKNVTSNYHTKSQARTSTNDDCLDIGQNMTDIAQKERKASEFESSIQQGNSSSGLWSKGTIVNVQSRTWPGVNKQGGVGRITAVNPDGTYNVAYVLGGKESNIEAVFIEKVEEDYSGTRYSGDAGTGASRRSRRAKNDIDALPEELLRQLAEEGFDTGVSLSSHGGRKRKKDSANTLADTTNESRNKRNDRKNVSKSSMRKNSQSRKLRMNASRDIVNGNSSLETNLSRKKRIPSSCENKSSEGKYNSESCKKAKTLALVSTEAKADWKDENVTGCSETTTVRKDILKRETNIKKSSKVEIREFSASPLDSLLNMSKEDATILADKRYKQRLEEAIASKLITVAASNLKEHDKALLKSICTRSLAGNVIVKTTETVSKKTTLCIVPVETNSGDSNIRACMRTLKVMKSALVGIPIVSTDWLRSCENGKRVLQPRNYVRSLPTKEMEIENSGDLDYGVAKLAASWYTQSKAPVLPFQTIHVYLCGRYSPDKRKNIQDLLKTGGAKIISKAQEVSSSLKSMVTSNKSSSIASSCRIVILCGDSGGPLPSSLQRDLKAVLDGEQHWPSPKAVTVVNSQWVIESVACAKPMPSKFFEPAFNKDLWKLSI